MLQQDDLLQIEKKGITLKIIENQMDNFHKGFPFIRLLRPAILEDGIFSFEEERKKELIHIFEEESPSLRVIKFVPASGAATRMFKHLFEFREKYKPGSGGENLLKKDTGPDSVNYYFNHLKEIAFYDELSLRLERDGLIIEVERAAIVGEPVHEISVQHQSYDFACDRTDLLGETDAARLLTFVITERKDKIRFVTAHPMHAKQREIYRGEE